jgi:hypothetical protein
LLVDDNCSILLSEFERRTTATTAAAEQAEQDEKKDVQLQRKEGERPAAFALVFFLSLSGRKDRCI